MALHAQAPRGQHDGAGVLGQIAGVEDVDVRRRAVGDGTMARGPARAQPTGSAVAWRSLRRCQVDAAARGCQDALGVRRIQPASPKSSNRR